MRLTSLCVPQILHTHQETSPYRMRAFKWPLAKVSSLPLEGPLWRWFYRHRNRWIESPIKQMPHQVRGLSSLQTGCSMNGLLDNEDNESEDDIEGWKVEETICAATVELTSSVVGKSIATATNMAWTEFGPTGSTSTTASVEVVDTLDPFAKAKILNFVQRMISLSSTSSNATVKSVANNGLLKSCDKSVYGPEIREVQGHSGGKKQYHAMLRLPLPVEYGLRYGEGFASTERDAELVAAMHAERVLDALGFHVYQLSSKQSRHAEIARKAGRWAPMPGEGEGGSSRPPPNTPSPPPLQYAIEDVSRSVSRQLQLDKVCFVNVTRGVFTPFRHTLASPYYYDFGSIKRIQSFFKAYNANIECYFKVIALHKIINKENKRHEGSESGSGQPSDANMEETHSFLAQLKLPIASRFGERVCMGKGPTKKEAIALACMHAELTIDALGLALYPTSKEKQAIHAMECAKVQRWCAPVGDCDFRYDAASPQPLQMLPDHMVATDRGTSTLLSEAHVTRCHYVDNYSTSNVPIPATRSAGEEQLIVSGRTASHTMPPSDEFNGFTTSTGSLISELQNDGTSVESMLIQHTHAVNNFGWVQDVGSVDKSAKLLLDHYLDHYYQIKYSKNANSSPGSLPNRKVLLPYLVECLGIKHRETYRATVTVPLFVSQRCCEGANQGVCEGQSHEHREKERDNGKISDKNATFVAIGIAKTYHEAEMAAATHALKVLAALNHPVVFSSESAFLLTSFTTAVTSDGRHGSFPCYDPTRPVKKLHEVTSHSSCMPVRCIGKEHVGRISIAGLSSEKQLSVTPVNRSAAAASYSSLTPSSRFFSDANQKTKLMESLLEARQTLSKSDWLLEEDGNNRIVVNPASTRESGRNYVHTLSGVRTPDVFAINRLRDYLERHGKSLETSLMHSWQEVDDEGVTMAQESSKQGNSAFPQTDTGRKTHLRPLLHVIKVVLPVSHRFGGAGGRVEGSEECENSKLSTRFIAHGEAYNEDDAVLMCAMHAELLLDTIGIPFYDHPVLQRKHIDTANMLGRQTAVGSAAKAPAPLRKEHPNSCLWARIQIRLAKEATTPSQPLVKRPEDVSETPTTVSFPSQSNMTTQADTLPNNQSGSSANDSDASAASFEYTDDNLCDISKLQSLHHTEVFRQALKHIRVYFQQRGSDFFRMVRQYTVKTSSHGTVYRAIVEIPVPRVYGKRFGVGCASTKGRALNLCASHAVWTLDALNIPIYSGRCQFEYAKSCKIAGRRSPTPGGTLMPGDTPSPKGLCDLSVGAVERPDPPALPSFEQVERDPAVWISYVRACKIFLKKTQEITLHESIFQLHQAPRSGVAVEDEGLNLVERMPVNSRAKHQLVRLCADAGLSRPEPFRYNVYGKAPEKWFLVETPVLGTVFKARGLAQSAADSLLRAAMHYEYLIQTAVLPQRTLSTLDKGFQGGRPLSTAGERLRRGKDLFDSTKGGFSTQGKAAALALYAATHRPYQPVQFILREGTIGSALPPSLSQAGKNPVKNPLVGKHIVVAAELSDDLGLRHSAKGEHPNSVSEAVERASNGLFNLLQRKAAIQSIGQVIKRHPSMRMGVLCTLANENEEAGVASLDATLIPLCKAAKKSAGAAPFVCEEFILDELKGLPLEGSRDLLSSSHAAVLLDIVSRRLDQSTTHVSLMPPAFIRDNFPALGLLLADSAHRGESSSKSKPDKTPKESVTPVAGAVALLMQCIPRQTIVGGRDHTLQHGPLLPIQLGKLLLAGLLFDCVPFAVRMAAMVMDLQGICSIANKHSHTFSDQGSEGGVQERQLHSWLSVDLVEEVLHRASPPSSLETTYENEICLRLCELQTQIMQYVPASQLSRLFSQLQSFKGIMRQENRLQNEAMQKEVTFLEARLRICVAFATYPQVLTPRVVSPRIVGESIVPGAADPSITVLESMDGTQQAYIKISARHARAPFAFFDVLLRSNSDAGQAVSPGEADTLEQRKSSCHRQVGTGHAHVCVAGTSVIPFANIVATVLGCNKYHVFSVVEEIPNLGIMLEGTVPLVFQSTAVMDVVGELQDVFAQSLSYLRPPPHEALHALDILLRLSENSNKL
ncbi:unnamed protein product [Phytomonas sp. EM1]|nr:unnamed protein product [Phytomonas sp. EM1]|eukprot:CCW59672.1 unnamed protein product [Phytomonas sp. isolate EM1]